MSKTKIEAKKVLDDIRAGLDDAALMEKYNLSTKGLHSVLEKLVALKALNESYIWTGRPPGGPVAQPAANRELSAKEVTKDIKSGMTDSDLMRKYKLSAKGLQNLLEQLIEAGLIKESDLELGKPLTESTVELTSDVLPPWTDGSTGLQTSPEPMSVEIEPSLGEESSCARSIPSAEKPPEHPVQEVPVSPPLEVTPPPVQTAPLPEKPQEVQITDRTEPAFPSTIPITVVAEQESEEPPPLTAEAAELPQSASKEEPTPAPKVEASGEACSTAEASVPGSAEEPRVLGETAVASSLPSEPQPQPEPPSRDYTQTIELVWKCPACGNPQHQAYDECPVCGVVLTKFFQHPRKETPPDTKIETKPPEQAHIPQRAPMETVRPEPVPPKPRHTPAPSKQEPLPKHKSVIQPPSKPEKLHEPEQPTSSPFLSKALSGMAVVQLLAVIACVGVRFVWERSQSFTADTLVWYLFMPVLVSIVMAALLYGVAAILKAGREIRNETSRNRQLLETILSRRDKPSD